MSLTGHGRMVGLTTVAVTICDKVVRATTVSVTVFNGIKTTFVDYDLWEGRWEVGANFYLYTLQHSFNVVFHKFILINKSYL